MGKCFSTQSHTERVNVRFIGDLEAFVQQFIIYGVWNPQLSQECPASIRLQPIFITICVPILMWENSHTRGCHKIILPCISNEYGTCSFLF